MGISGGGLATWVAREAGKVSTISDQVADIQPKVQRATDTLNKASQDQLEWIKSQSDSIVRGSIQKRLGSKEIAGPVILENQNPGPVTLMRTSEAFCWLGGIFGQLPPGVASTVGVEPDKDGYWKLTVNSTANHVIDGRAYCLKY